MWDVNVVVKPGWILERLARELQRLPGVTVNNLSDEREVRADAALQYYLPARDVQKYPCPGRMAGLFTHGESGFELIPQFTGISAMNHTMGRLLRSAGAPDVAVMRPGVDPPVRPIVFGVIGRVYHSGRKGEGLVKQAVRDGFSFVACGGPRVRATPRRQWPCATPYTVEDRAEFYRAIDYLVVTSTEEGGPMTVPEAIAYGVPVIAPAGVGWCDEFPCLGRYVAGDYASLRAVLRALTQPPTWKQWADDHGAWFTRLLEAA